MKNIFAKINWTKIKLFAGNHKPLTIVSVFILISLIFVLFGKGGSASATSYVFGRVQIGDLAVSVSGSGQVATLGQVSIQPQTVGQTQTLGQIISVNVKNGDFVKAGQVIAVLDGQNALQSLNQAKASVESAQASYNKLVDGPTALQLQSINNSIQSDNTTIQNDQQNTLISIQNAYLSAANSVYINTDPFFQNVTSVNPTLSISGINFSDQQLQSSVSSGRASVGAALNAWNNEINTAASSTASSTNVVALLNDSISYLNQVRAYFDDMTSLFSSYGIAQNSTAQSSLNSDKSTASGALSSIDSSISSLTSALQSYNNAVTSLANDNQNLALQTAPANPDDITVAKSALDNANASLANAEQNYASRIITAPFDGQIGGLTAQIGQQISSATSLGTLITAQRVVNVTLNEVDASKVAANDPVQITFNALPGLTINGHVNFIDPLGTVSQGVVSYNVQVILDQQNDSIKTGMTAVANIATVDHPNTLMVPNSAIVTSGNQKYVLVAQFSSSTMPNIGGFGSSTRRNFASSTLGGGYGSGFGSTSSAFSSSTFANSSTTRQRNTSSTGIQFPANMQPTVIKVPVTVGISNTTETEILSGLTEGQFIVTRTITGTAATTAKSAAAAATTRGVGGGAGGAVRIGGGFGGGAVGGASLGGAAARL